MEQFIAQNWLTLLALLGALMILLGIWALVRMANDELVRAVYIVNPDAIGHKIKITATEPFIYGRKRIRYTMDGTPMKAFIYDPKQLTAWYD